MFKEGNFKEFEKVEKDGTVDGEVKENNIKEGWFRDDDESITIHHHSKQTAKSDAEEKSKWNQFIDSTKKIVNSLKQDASDWYNKSETEEKAKKTSEPTDDTASNKDTKKEEPAKDAAKKPVDSKKVDDFKKPSKMAADSDKPVYHFEQNDADWDEDDYDMWDKAGKGMKDDEDLENWGDNAVIKHESGNKDDVVELEEDYSDFSDFESLEDLEEDLRKYGDLVGLDMVDFELMQLYAEIDEMNQVINTVY